jgi:hypothetical protein
MVAGRGPGKLVCVSTIKRFVSLLSLGLLTSTGCNVPLEAVEGESGTEDETEGSQADDTDGDTAGSLPATPTLLIGFSQVKQFEFSWAPTSGADYYQLLERSTVDGDYLQVGDDIAGESVLLTMPLHFRASANYMLRACNGAGCMDSAGVAVTGALTDAIGYFKASNTDADDLFGWSLALSADGNTLAVGAIGEDSNAIGIGGDGTNDSALEAGAVYVYRQDPATGNWTQQAYVKPLNTNPYDYFGWRVALSANGDTLAVSAIREDSKATGVGGNGIDNSAPDAGAVYIFGFDAINGWAQKAYVKPSNTDKGDNFGTSLALSDEGNTLAVGASGEDGNSVGIGGDEADNSALGAGAVYLFQRDVMDTWTQQAYIKASNTGAGDDFGQSLAMAANGDTLAIGAAWEDSNATGIDGNQVDDSAADAGAVYVYTRDALATWTQEAYVKPSNSGMEDFFGDRVALSADGATLAVGARGEDSNAMGMDGDQADGSAQDAGAVYVFRRDPNGWMQQAYVKSSNTSAGDSFGSSVVLSADGDMLFIGAVMEDADGIGVDGDQTNDSATDAGAAYVYQWDPSSGWRQRSYIKASNAGVDDRFGESMALSPDGGTMVVGAYWEDGVATGVSSNQGDDSASNAGAVYMY